MKTLVVLAGLLMATFIQANPVDEQRSAALLANWGLEEEPDIVTDRRSDDAEVRTVPDEGRSMATKVHISAAVAHLSSAIQSLIQKEVNKTLALLSLKKPIGQSHLKSDDLIAEPVLNPADVNIVEESGGVKERPFHVLPGQSYPAMHYPLGAPVYNYPAYKSPPAAYYRPYYYHPPAYATSPGQNVVGLNLRSFNAHPTPPGAHTRQHYYAPRRRFFYNLPNSLNYL